MTWMQKGYLWTCDVTHPLASKGKGMVAVHRTVLYDTIGPGVHACHWCAVPVEWGTTLQADHLDSDPLNNDPANLVPSCLACNVKRRRKHTFLRGEHHGRAKLTQSQVNTMRREHYLGVPVAVLARRYGASARNVQRIVARTTWR